MANNNGTPSKTNPSQDLSLVQVNQAMQNRQGLIRFQNQTFRTLGEVLQWIRNQAPERRVNLARSLMIEVLTLTEAAADALLSVEDFMKNDLKISDKDMDRDEVIVRSRQLTAPRRRERDALTEIKKRLVLTYNISTTALDAVASLVLRDNTTMLQAVANSLRDLRATLRQVLQAASYIAVQRLAKARPGKGIKFETHITNADLVKALGNLRGAGIATQNLFEEAKLNVQTSSGLERDIARCRIDRHGIFWPPGVVPPDYTWTEDGMSIIIQGTTPQRAKAQAQSMQAPKPTASRMQLRPRITSKKSSLGAIAASTEARQKRQRLSNTDKPASEMSAEEFDSQLSEIGEVQDGFSRMNMSPKLPPVTRPWSPALKNLPFRGSRYDQDLWDIFGERAKQRAGITQGGVVNDQEIRRRISRIPLARFCDSMQIIGREAESLAAQLIRENRVDEARMMDAYMLAASDVAEICKRFYASTSTVVANIRATIHGWEEAFGPGRPVQAAAGLLEEEAVLLNRDDLESLQYDDTHDGWLTATAIQAVLTNHADSTRVQVGDPVQGAVWLTHAAELPADRLNEVVDLLPEWDGQRNFLLPLFMGTAENPHDGHHAVIYFEPMAQSNVVRVRRADSIWNDDQTWVRADAMARAVVQNLARQTGRPLEVQWGEENDHSPELWNESNMQDDGYNCGLWAIRNGINFMNGIPLDTVETVGLQDRHQIAAGLLQATLDHQGLHEMHAIEGRADGYQDFISRWQHRHVSRGPQFSSWNDFGTGLTSEALQIKIDHLKAQRISMEKEEKEELDEIERDRRLYAAGTRRQAAQGLLPKKMLAPEEFALSFQRRMLEIELRVRYRSNGKTMPGPAWLPPTAPARAEPQREKRKRASQTSAPHLEAEVERGGHSSQRIKSFAQFNKEMSCPPAQEGSRQGTPWSEFDPFALPDTPTPAPRTSQPPQTQPSTGGLQRPAQVTMQTRAQGPHPPPPSGQQQPLPQSQTLMHPPTSVGFTPINQQGQPGPSNQQGQPGPTNQQGQPEPTNQQSQLRRSTRRHH